MFLIQSKFIGEINRFFDRSGFKLGLMTCSTIG